MKSWSNLNDRVLMAETISRDHAESKPAPAAPPEPKRTLESHLQSHAPFIPASVVAAIEKYEREFEPLDKAYHAAAPVNADAEFEKRVNSVRENPSPENIAALNAESGDELRKKYSDRRAVFEKLRAECIERNATAISPRFIAPVERVVDEFRRQILADFRELGERYGTRLDGSQSDPVKNVDRWLWCFKQTHQVAERAAANRWPPMWQSELPLPSDYRKSVMNNLAPVPDPVETGALKTAADLAAAKA